MNRLQALELPEPVAEAPAIRVESGVFTRSRVDQPCALFAPLHYETNYAYPLLVWLHGPGDDENQLRRVMPLISLRNYVGVSIRGTQAVTLHGGRQAFTWTDNAEDLAAAEQRLFDAIELARERFHVAPDRVFLAGYDVGGSAAFRLALANPQAFAGVLSLGGEFPIDHAPLRWLHDLRRLPLFLAYARDGGERAIANVCAALRLFHVARLKANLFQYPCSQQLTTKMLEDMDRWIMEQVTGATQVSVQ